MFRSPFSTYYSCSYSFSCTQPTLWDLLPGRPYENLHKSFVCWRHCTMRSIWLLVGVVFSKLKQLGIATWLHQDWWVSWGIRCDWLSQRQRWLTRMLPIFCHQHQPEPRPDHALAMAKFALDCKSKMKALVLKLEKFLGPGMCALSISILFSHGQVMK